MLSSCMFALFSHIYTTSKLAFQSHSHMLKHGPLSQAISSWALQTEASLPLWDAIALVYRNIVKGKFHNIVKGKFHNCHLL